MFGDVVSEADGESDDDGDEEDEAIVDCVPLLSTFMSPKKSAKQMRQPRIDAASYFGPLIRESTALRLEIGLKIRKVRI